MKYQTLLEILSTSVASDWLYNEQRGIYTYKADLNLRIERKDGNDDGLGKFEGEDWATKHPDSNAYRVFCEVFYGASFVEDRLLVAVDGFRAILPLPDRETNEIDPKDYSFAAIIDRGGMLDEYIRRAGLTVLSQ